MNFLLQSFHYFAAPCTEHGFFGLETWYHYLNLAGKFQQNAATGRCELVTLTGGFQVTDLVLISLAIVDDLLRIAALIAIGYVMYGCFQLITSQGEADKAKHGQQTMWNAMIGLGIALASVGAVAFLGRSIK